MAVKFKSISVQVSAMTLAVATLMTPIAAQAQLQEPDRQIEADMPDQAPRVEPPAPPMPPRLQGDWSRPAETPAPAAAPVYTQGETAAARNRGDWDRGRQSDWNRSAEGERRIEGDRRGNGNRWSGWNRSGQDQATTPPRTAEPLPQTPVTQGRSWEERSRDGWRNDERRAWARGEHLRNGDHDRRDGDRWRRDRDNRDLKRDGDRWRSDRNSWGHGENRWRHDGNRYGYGKHYRRWDNRWRDNRRYDWWSYRRSNPQLYRHSYYAPYRNYSYRRLSIGFYLDSLFFGSRYWINNPWQYRLPDVYGPYRWIRYYDDALLVNIHTGEVVDVIYRFFW
ncbi:MAG: RcnB family protein [Novosphingobium sp.]|nr:RcnB family protein [Novosphingobium sp.]